MLGHSVSFGCTPLVSFTHLVVARTKCRRHTCQLTRRAVRPFICDTSVVFLFSRHAFNLSVYRRLLTCDRVPARFVIQSRPSVRRVPHSGSAVSSVTDPGAVKLENDGQGNAMGDFLALLGWSSLRGGTSEGVQKAGGGAVLISHSGFASAALRRLRTRRVVPVVFRTYKTIHSFGSSLMTHHLHFQIVGCTARCSRIQHTYQLSST
ncbi:uncharacterized protein B0H18DRAFT_469530 [Fomitopsis serialis]|uniref:uncharacterized protein n=1 Tax=Fomitopsis serialis TaxID=139415 RepID=UPI0020080968|nr:uncharacterized protein B0H18DRAFT_469530 [Neoantrodia serialis]KAH9923349.1 hypothetical protein B0H18DRAFT_469530 [Neoantrodia serialis]